MSDSCLQTPVAFLVFNRPALTARVLERIREAKPRTLLVVADGPRTTHPDDPEKCRLSREIIEGGVDWPCQVLRNYSDTNLGCKRRVSSGITWVFEQVEEAIILEDDCLPHPSFFRYCEELLGRYRSDGRILAISADWFGGPVPPGGASYTFSRYPFCWAWASWRRAWACYDVEMKSWPAFRDSGKLGAVFESPDLQKFWQRAFEGVYRGEIDTWDYQWAFTLMSQGALGIIPRVNLAENIGFGPDATHTTGKRFTPGHTPGGMIFPMRHPEAPVRDVEADHAAEVLMMYPPSLLARILRKVRNLIRRVTSRGTSPTRQRAK